MSSGAATPDAVVSHHLDGFRSGVARFNELLAQRLGVPLLGLGELAAAEVAQPLLSFKARELDDEARETVEHWLERHTRWDVFLHEYRGLPLEERLVRGATRVLCGNHEVYAAVEGIASEADIVWTPGLILDQRVFPDVELSVFTFGMAHKIRTSMFARLRELLDASGRSYAVFASAANHETASLRDSADVFAELHEIFPETLFFLGNLSDVAVFNWLESTTYFASFFPRGVRANNTSVASALERGAVVITNLDEHSPPELVHGANMIDVNVCDALPSEPETLRALGDAAAATARNRSWDALLQRIGG